ncbi:MAG: anthranilate synthase component II [Magnetospiraceae bacterium]
MFILIDNYDSFTYNLVHFLGELGAEIEVHRNDAITPEAVLDKHPEGVILSPGPCDPDQAGICLDMVAKAAAVQMPLLGVCLGHQSIGQAFGGKIVRAPEPVHGKVHTFTHTGTGLFTEVPTPFKATRYHSLVVDRSSLPDCLGVSAETEDGLIMAMAHKELPIHGVQFHPESIASDHGHHLLKNFLTIAAQETRA